MAQLIGFLVILFTVFGSATANFGFFGRFGQWANYGPWAGWGGGWGGGGSYSLGCTDISYKFGSCQSYVEGTDSYASPQCCSGLQELNSIATSEPGGTRRICQCIQEMGNSGFHPSFSQSRLRQIFLTCSMNNNFPISNNIDCSSIY